MAKIAFFEIKKWEEKYLKKKLKQHELIFFKEALDENNAEYVKDCEVVSVFIYSKVSRSVLEKLKKVRMIATRSTGFDHIDLKACKKKEIRVCNVPSYGENTVAEHTFALILALSRQVHKSYHRAMNNDFSIEGLTGFDLRNKTIGVVGGGHIGMHVVKIAKGFGMRVLVYDLNHDDFMAEMLGFEYAGFEELLQKSDIISLHVPYNKHTHHLINKDSLANVKNNSILINTARGAIVDTDALLEALESKRIGGAGLDVIEGEDLIKEEKQLLHSDQNVDKWKTVVRDHRIFQMENVVFTPHNGFNSNEALYRIMDTTISNISGFFEGNCQANAVNGGVK